jgi:hypothetical protein
MHNSFFVNSHVEFIWRQINKATHMLVRVVSFLISFQFSLRYPGLELLVGSEGSQLSPKFSFFDIYIYDCKFYIRLFCGSMVSSHPCNLSVKCSSFVGVYFIFYFNFLNYYRQGKHYTHMATPIPQECLFCAKIYILLNNL